MRLTYDVVTSVTEQTLDHTRCDNIWLPAVTAEIAHKCNRTFTGDDADSPVQARSSHWVSEVPGGVVDGDNTIFTLSQTPTPGKIMLYRDGQLLAEEIDYQVTGKQVNFALPPQPGSGQPLFVRFLPQGQEDDYEETDVPDYPADLGVAACWRVVLLASQNPLADGENRIKSETMGSVKVEYFEGRTLEEKLASWEAILARYRIPAL